MRFPLLVLLIWLIPFSYAASDDPAVSYLQLAVAVHVQHMTGLQLEAMVNPDPVRLYRGHAQDFAMYRKGELSAQQAALTPAQCADGQPLRNPFCAFISEDWKMAVLRARFENDNPEGVRTSGLSRSEVEQVAVSLRNTDLGNLEDIAEPDIRRAINGFGTPDEIAAISRKVLDDRKCPSANILAALGLKHEEFFPDRKHIDLSIELYSRADQCSKLTDLSGARARFRLGLIYMMDSGCAKAEPVFERLADYKVDDGMVSRALYWIGRCSLDEGNRLKTEVFRNRLVKWNPLGFHTLKLNEDRKSQLSGFLMADQPELLMRSKVAPDLNPIVKAVEAIQETSYPVASHDFLNYLKLRSSAAEPAFQLYIALLCERVTDMIGKFQLMARAFRQDPRLISEETLRIFYPIRDLDSVKGSQPKADPLLVLSLIRQESGFNPHALSHTGAMGLMQLMPMTARRMGLRNRRALYGEATNIRLGVRYFDNLLKRFGGDQDLALAAYNAGPERVDDWKRRYPTQDRVLFIDLIPFSETRNYVALIGRNYYWYQQLYGSPGGLSVAARKHRKTKRLPAAVTAGIR